MEYLWFLKENHGISMVNGISMEYLWLMET